VADASALRSSATGDRIGLAGHGKANYRSTIRMWYSSDLSWHDLPG
jgi:hypothetical protein